MRLANTLLAALALAAPALLAPGDARAASINGSVALAGSTVANTGNILTATSFTFGGPGGTGTLLATGATGDFTPFVPMFSNATVTALVPGAPGSDVVLSFASSAGTFNGVTLLSDVATTNGTSRLRDISILGTFTPAGAFASAGFDATASTLTFSFNQPLSGGSIGFGASLSSPAAVPEPASLASCAIAGLAGLGLAARRARRAQA